MELSIDTSTRYASVGVSDQGSLVEYYSWYSRYNHSVELLPAVESVLGRSKVNISGIDCMIVALGPGGFSSLRVGLSTVKGFAMSLGVPIVGLNTLDIEAYPFRNQALPVCAMLDVGRGELARAIYVSDESGWAKVKEDSILSVQDIIQSTETATLFCGEGLIQIESELKTALNGLAVTTGQYVPTRHPSVLSALGFAKFIDGALSDAYSMEPHYMRRPSITERKR